MQPELDRPTVLWMVPKTEYTAWQVRLAEHWVNCMRPGILFVLEPPARPESD